MADHAVQVALAGHTEAIKRYAGGVGSWDDVLQTLEELDVILHTPPEERALRD